MKPNCFSADPTCLDQLPYPLSSVCTSSLHADGRARIWTCLPHSSGALPCSLPLWVRLTPAGWGEEFRDPTHNPLIIPTPASCGGGEWVKQLPAAPLPGSLQLALTWPDSRLLRSLALEPTHMLGSPTLVLPGSYSGLTPRNLMQGEDRQLKSGPSPPVCPLAITLSRRSRLEGQKHGGRGRGTEG